MPVNSSFLRVGLKYLITLESRIRTPDGEAYGAVFGTLRAVHKAQDVIGVYPGRGHENWMVEIGNVIIPGCQVKFCIQTDSYSTQPPSNEIEHEGEVKLTHWHMTRIYNVDSGLTRSYLNDGKTF